MCRIAIVDVYGMMSFNSRVLKQMLHAKEEQEAALNVPCTKRTLSAVNCVYTTHLSESVQERDQKEVIEFMGRAQKKNS
jgi:molybdopterin-guanine dinucleotide biosynthesis protein A